MIRSLQAITLAALLVALGMGACTRPDPPPVVALDSGKVRGVRVGDAVAFRGIPFAASTGGDNRWRPPQPVANWEGIRSAEIYGPFCPQFESELLWFELGEMSEDCLSLNVWAPAKRAGQKLPVMVWIHGGGYVQGSGNIPQLNSPALAREGVILVTLNYRLSVFGFFAHPEMTRQQQGELLGNYGLMDIIAGLEWVQRNIGQFGGDPDNVTIFGESAGGALINYLMIAPSARTLFDRAISMSASVGLAPDARIRGRSGFQVPGESLGQGFAKRAGVSNNPDPIAALRAMSMDELLALLTPTDRFTPMIEGELLPDYVGMRFAQGQQNDVPYLAGGVSWEAKLGRQVGGAFSPDVMSRLVPAGDKQRLYPGLTGAALADTVFGDLIIHAQSRYLGDMMATVSSPTYQYYFSYVAEERRGRDPGVGHADEIVFVMQTLDTELTSPTAGDRDVSKLLSSYFIQFARTGNPNRPGLPDWPVYTRAAPYVLEIGETTTVHADLWPERMNYFRQRGISSLEKAHDQALSR